ncbi:TPA: type 1 fimbrial protein [Escherichia coli]|nr:fimbrial protein [Escherichia marmotae]HAY0228463.1 type 1 fimbrial protein [Escherichia coli]HEL8020826.1 type 1 fimbrial protein [Escherichia coli]HEL8087195.1 type 1 fimbrial protein [Escherichia coli]HEL8092332.1 type 1 fimbrial protein [Escherichia coli]
MFKTVMAGAVAMALVSFGANAANQGQGVVNFKGTVIDAPCGIDPDSADQSIDFGQISKSHLNADGISVKKDLDIKLVNCDFSAADAKKTVSVAFSGTTVNNATEELGTAGDTGTAVVISASDGSLVKFDGATTSNGTQLLEGDNTLRYSTWVKKATGGTVTEGDFTAVAHFNLTYN